MLAMGSINSHEYNPISLSYGNTNICLDLYLYELYKSWEECAENSKFTQLF